MSLKFSLIFVELYCLFVVTRCVETRFDISDVISDSSSYFYTTRGLEEESLGLEILDDLPSEPVPVKPVYTLAKDFVADLEVLLHKITQIFVKIGKNEEGQKTVYHIYDEVFTIASNGVSIGTLNYIMSESVKVMQDPNASKIVVEFFKTVQDLMEYDLSGWNFVVPFLYDLIQHPMPEQILGKFKSEVEYILIDEERKKAFAAAFKLLEDVFSNTATAIPIEDIGNAEVTQIPVKRVKNKQGSVEEVQVKQVTQVPVNQVEQVTQIPVKVKTTQISDQAKQVTTAPIKQVTTVPVKQVITVPVKEVEQVAQIPAVTSTQIVEEVTPVETVQSAAPESAASRLLRRVKSLPSSFKRSTTVEQT